MGNYLELLSSVTCESCGRTLPRTVGQFNHADFVEGLVGNERVATRRKWKWSRENSVLYFEYTFDIVRVWKINAGIF